MLCQRHFSCRPRVAPVLVMGSGCVVVHVHGAGLARSVHCSGSGSWRVALLVCTHSGAGRSACLGRTVRGGRPPVLG